MINRDSKYFKKFDLIETNLLPKKEVLSIIYDSLNNYLKEKEIFHKILYLEIIKRKNNILKVDKFLCDLIYSINEYYENNFEIKLILKFFNKNNDVKKNIKKIIELKIYLLKKLGLSDELNTNLDDYKLDVTKWLTIIEDVDFFKNHNLTKILNDFEKKLLENTKNHTNVNLSIILKILMDLFIEDTYKFNEIKNKVSNKDEINNKINKKNNNFNTFVNTFTKENNLTLGKVAVRIKNFELMDTMNNNYYKDDNHKINLDKEITNLEKILYKEKKQVNKNELNLNNKVKDLKKISNKYDELYNIISFMNNHYEEIKKIHSKDLVKEDKENFSKKFKCYTKNLLEYKSAFNLFTKYQTLKNIN